ncbi:MAG TPA: sigma-70 family RNA polymerase sigma factor [Pirellulales bacterium]|nr:sigma-70 family RNA polymerase sigma factor [Pirellulales bacterium]
MGDLENLTDADLVERYLATRDEAAFATIVRRHGAMVRGVCRRVLHDVHEADDAFQATFLVLLRKASSISPRALLANWLYGVARRTALKTRTMIRKRQSLPREASEPAEQAIPTDLKIDLAAVLDEELERLPGKYRAVIVLSDLEGGSRAAVARQLALPEGTVSSRLNRGRAMLRRRLTRRGLDLAPAGLAAALAQQATEAAVPSALEALALQAAQSGAASVYVGELVRAVAKSLVVAKAGALLTTWLVAVAIVGGGALAGYALLAPEATPTASPSAAAPPNDRAGDAVSAVIAEDDVSRAVLGDDATLEEVLAAWDASGSRLKSYDVYLRVDDKSLLDRDNMPLEEPFIDARSSHQLFSAGKRRIESNVGRPGQQATAITIWDGRRAIFHAIEANQIRVEKNFDAPDPTCDFESLFQLAHGTWLWTAMLRERPDTRLTGRESGLFVVDTPTTLGKRYEYSPYGLRFWLDPKKGCLPVKHQMLYPESGQDIVLMEAENQLQEFAPGVWAPASATARIYPLAIQEVSPPRVHTKRTWTVDLGLSTFNAQIPDAMFELDPP